MLEARRQRLPVALSGGDGVQILSYPISDMNETTVFGICYSLHSQTQGRNAEWSPGIVNRSE